VFAVFALMDLSPTDPAARIAGEGGTEEDVQFIRERLGLDRPLPERYVSWLGNAVQGDFGESLTTGEAVSTRMWRAAPVTASLAVLAVAFSTVVGMAMAVVATWRPRGLVDQAVTALASIAVA